MIVVDTSALMAIALDEPMAEACMDAATAADILLISAATLTELLIVAAQRKVSAQAGDLVDHLGLTIVALTEARARAAAAAYQRWGKGFHAACLGYGDSFAYALATERDCPLLFIGNDFAQTDVVSALASTAATSCLHLR